MSEKGGGKMFTLMFTLLLLPVLFMLIPLFLVIGIIGMVLRIGFSVMGWILKGIGGFVLLIIILALIL